LNPCGAGRENSNVVCNINADLLLSNNTNTISWDHIQTGQEQESRIGRNSISDYITIPSGTNNFDDLQIQCETFYCYSVTIIYSDGSESKSPEVCGTSFSSDTPSLIQDLSVDILNDGARLDWEGNTQIDTVYLLQYSNTNDLLAKDTAIANSRFIETDVRTYPQTCYSHSYKDVCKNTSGVTPQICSIYLTTDSNADGSITLNWTEFSGFQDSISNYSIQKYDQSGSLLESIDVGRNLTFADQITGQNDQIVRYVIEGSPANTLFLPIHSNAVETARRVQLNFPTAFSPNGDGLNDIFKPEYLFIRSYELQVYNRWGQLLFSSDDVDKGWDGTFNGSKVPVESYTYLSSAEDFQGLKIARSGIVTILKD
jgi:gliding motility-associated-like protein